MRRIFTSLNPPTQIISALKSYQRPEFREIKWTKQENLHITLNFLGYLQDEEITEVKEILKRTVSKYLPFSIILNQLKFERDMLWLLPEKNSVLLNLQGELKNKLEEVRLLKREKRSYSPHILLAKFKNRGRIQSLFQNFAPLQFFVDRINLYESKLTPVAATHILIQNFPFAGQ